VSFGGVALVLITFAASVLVADDPTNEMALTDDPQCLQDMESARVPPPFDEWVLLICTIDGQKLVSVPGHQNFGWYRHNSSTPFLLHAEPDYELRIKLRSEIGGNNIKFAALSGSEISGDMFEPTRKIIVKAFPEYDVDVDLRVFALAVSGHGGELQTLLIFPVTEGSPHNAIWMVPSRGKYFVLDRIPIKEKHDLQKGK